MKNIRELIDAVKRSEFVTPGSELAELIPKAETELEGFAEIIGWAVQEPYLERYSRTLLRGTAESLRNGTYGRQPNLGGGETNE